MSTLVSILLFACILSICYAGHDHHHDHVIIHVPFKIKTIHHTHKITKHIHHGGDKYEVLGYTVGHPVDIGGHGGGGGGHDFGGGGDYGGGHGGYGGGGYGTSSFGGGGWESGGGGYDLGGGGGGHGEY